jgi:tryptophan-rich sensory protein
MAIGKAGEGLSPVWAAGLALGTVAVAAVIGSRASPTPDHPRTRRWYKRLEKPSYTPPSGAFAIAWTCIQASLAYGGYRLLRAEPSPARSTALALWAGNQVGVGGWSEVFFGNRAPGWGTIASAALAANAVCYVAAADSVDKTAARTGLPLVAWVAFATLLSEEIWRRNEPS